MLKKLYLHFLPSRARAIYIINLLCSNNKLLPFYMTNNSKIKN